MVISSMNTNLSFRMKQFTKPHCPGFSPSTLHAGPNQSLVLVRTKYWILNYRNLIQKIITNCVLSCCFKTRGILALLCDMPKKRIHVPVRVLQDISIDFGFDSLFGRNKLLEESLILQGTFHLLCQPCCAPGISVRREFTSLYCCIMKTSFHVEAVLRGYFAITEQNLLECKRS